MAAIFEIILSVIVEILGWLFIEFLYRMVVAPILFQIGAAVKWIVLLGRKPLSVIRGEKHNRTIGFLLVLAAIVAIVIQL